MTPLEKWKQRYAWHLESIPELLLIVRSSMIPFGAARADVERVDGSREAPLPFREGAVDDADDLWALLVLYASEVVELIGGSSPRVLRGSSWTVGEAVGLPARMGSVAASNAAAEIVTWLVQRSETVVGFSGLEDSETQLFGRVRSLRAKYGLEDRQKRARLRACPVCEAQAVMVTFGTVAGREECLVRCSSCGEEFGDDADLLASGAEGAALSGHDQALAT